LIAFNLGSDKQINDLVERNKRNPRLGCFALTEVLAGVNSGLIVNTTAVLENGGFTINTPFPGAAKNWISQGMVADEAVVVASLTVNGKQLGPQAFLVVLRGQNGQLVDGVNAVDMGRKTVGNDLDNARLTFTNFRVPIESLLCRYLKVTSNGQINYLENRKSMEMIGQRLFSGRIAVAQACLVYAMSLFENTRAFATKKQCWVPEGNCALITVPQIKAIFKKADYELSRLFQFMLEIEKELCNCISKNDVPPVSLQEKIAVGIYDTYSGKVKCIESSIELCHSLKQEVGSYALMAGTGFEQMDFITCCKFAEGDSRILMQKMARDLMIRGPSNELEKKALNELKMALAKEMKSGKSKKEAWDDCYQLVYSLADAHMEGVMHSVLQGAKL
jgi:acyl-CoA oxidase